MTRDPDFSKLQEGTLDKIKSEFKRIFGGDVKQMETLKKDMSVSIGKGSDFGRKKPISTQPGAPLIFDQHLKRLDHSDCRNPEDYPDLKYSIVERQKIKEAKNRAERL